MDTTGIFILMFLCAFAALLIYFVVRRDVVWRQFADERNGKFEAGSPGHPLSLTFEHLGRKIKLSLLRTYGSMRGAIEIQLEWPESSTLEVELVPRLTGLLLKKSGPEISLEDHRLAQSHVLCSNDAQQVHSCLTPIVLDSLVKLDSLWSGCEGLQFLFSGGQLKIIKPGECWRKSRIHDLANLVIDVDTKLMQTTGVHKDSTTSGLQR